MPKQTEFLTKGQKTRALILKRALEVIAKEGFEAASLRQIAKDCGISQATTFYHFPNKEDLIDSLIQEMVLQNHQHVSVKLVMTDNAFQRLSKHFEGNLEWAFQFPSYASLLVLLYYMATFNKTFAERYDRLLGNARLRVQEHLLAGQREGIFHFHQDSAVVARILHDGLVGSFINMMTVSSLKKTARLDWFEKENSHWLDLIKTMTNYRPSA